METARHRVREGPAEALPGKLLCGRFGTTKEDLKVTDREGNAWDLLHTQLGAALPANTVATIVPATEKEQGGFHRLAVDWHRQGWKHRCGGETGSRNLRTWINPDRTIYLSLIQPLQFDSMLKVL